LKKAFGRCFHILGIDAPAYIQNLNYVLKEDILGPVTKSPFGLTKPSCTDLWGTGKFYLSMVYGVLVFN
jgi:hypothetical protein